ncbi:MAG TPA: nitronate monooxygenase [Solirubrobacteraceae bacterium]|nr:nitronate monooxygenase [Solirubrobacteraceae bacterium]
MSVLADLRVPIVQAPLAGGPSTPELTAAVSGAGAFGFVAAGYKTPDAVRDELRALRSMTPEPFGVNVFVPGSAPDPAAYEAYLEGLRAEAEAHGVQLGEPRFEDDAWDAKLALLEADRVAAVSFTFGCPASEVVGRLRAAGSEVWVTVTDVAEAQEAADAGADALVVQGVEAGGHRGSFVDGDGAGDYGLLALLQLVRARVDLPLVASGGIATGGAVAAVLCAGARAAQIGTAFLRTREAGTAPAHRDAVASRAPTRLTRAFTGRQARGIVNRFLREHSAEAPTAYPNVHHATAPLRAAGRNAGDADVLNLWAGQTHELAPDVPAAELVATLAAGAAESLDAARLALSRRADA